MHVRLRATAGSVAALLTFGLIGGLPHQAAAADTDPPGAPGTAATWTTGAKQAIGTSTTSSSKVWFTLAGGTLTEVFYPTNDTANVRELSFAVTDGATWAQRETDGTTRTLKLLNRRSPTYRQTTSDAAGRWKLTKTYVTDPRRSSVVVDVAFQNLTGKPLELYALYDPTLAQTYGDDTGGTVASADGLALVAADAHSAIASALVAKPSFSVTSTGYVGTSDGWTDLADHKTLSATYSAATAGNIAQVGRIDAIGRMTHVTLALSFAADTNAAEATARSTLEESFSRLRTAYNDGWVAYTRTLKRPPAALSDDLARQYYAALITLKALEDKTHRGAFVASLSTPWGQTAPATGQSTRAGTHLVQAREVYQQATALLAAGDHAAAKRAVRWIFEHQQAADGHIVQATTVDGTVLLNGVQLDQTALPLVLAWRVGRFDRAFYTGHVRPAADFLVATGPVTPQDRWQDAGGYSPATIAAEIAGLVAAADIARHNGDDAGATHYEATADAWQQQVEAWTYTTTGALSDGRYYVRVSGSGKPDDGASRDFGPGSGVRMENAVVDAGFLELVRLGVKPASDPAVRHSVIAVDRSLKSVTKSGPVWRRFTFDAYGERASGRPWAGIGVGRPWPLLTGERGEYVLARGGDATEFLRIMARTAGVGLMLPQQVWDRSYATGSGHTSGKTTAAVAPYGWTSAEFVRLALGIGAGAPVERPGIVAQRYAERR